MNKQDYHIYYCSFGKDSLAMILNAVEQGKQIDEVCHCKIMFSDAISGEFPDHEAFINNIAIPYLKDKLALNYVEISNKTYLKVFFTKFKKGKHIGEYYGFPQRFAPVCNSRLKLLAIEKHKTELRKNYNIIEHVGIAADETKRIKSAVNKGIILDLVNEDITEKDCYKICEKYGLLSPLYTEYGFKRIGCFFCPNASMKELKILYQKHYALFYMLMNLDKYSPERKFKDKYTVHDLKSKFDKELQKVEEK